MPDAYLSLWVKAAYIVISLLVVLILFLTTYRIVRKLLGAIVGSGSVFGSDGRARVIGFGLAGLLFPRVLSELVRLTVALFVGIFYDLPVALMAQYQRAVPYCRPDGPRDLLDQCFGQLGLGFASAFGRGLDSWYGDKIRYFPFADLMLMLAAWAILAQVFAPAPSDKGSASWLQAAYGRLSAAGRQNLRFFIVLAIAGYLSIAAIAAIPSLREPTQGVSGPTLDALKQAVAEGVKPIDVTQLERDNPFSPLDETQLAVSDAPAKQAAEVAAPTTPPGDPQVAQSIPKPSSDLAEAVKFSTSMLKQQRIELIGDLKQLGVNAELDLQKARALAATTYDANNAGRRGTREQTEHYLLIIAWYRDTVVMFESSISNCRAAIVNMDRGWNNWASAQKDLLQLVAKNLAPSRPIDSDVSSFERYVGTRESCQSVRTVENVPARPELGAYLGPFGFIARWLVRTESLPLALVVGLLGFGLLGSACSTFVREQRTHRSEEGVLVKNLPGVVIRGLSAAIVVFLAVEGGLAIFAGGASDPNPNPYVLLLTCLIGAVFSEQVWDWAQRRLRTNFGSDSEDGGPKGGGPKGSDSNASNPPATDPSANSSALRTEAGDDGTAAPPDSAAKVIEHAESDTRTTN